jgi:predicted XRE-type DNA-binding protein
MKKYIVNIKENSKKYIVVKANSKEEAIIKIANEDIKKDDTEVLFNEIEIESVIPFQDNETLAEEMKLQEELKEVIKKTRQEKGLSLYKIAGIINEEMDDSEVASLIRELCERKEL